MSPWMVALVISAPVLIWMMASFNRFISQRQLIDNSWANVETELRRRHDLIPSLVTTVEAYADHEHDTFTIVAEARRSAMVAAGGADQQQGVESLLVSGLRQLFAVSEAYPELLASESYLDLQRELITTEDRIQAARGLFNGNVRDYNRRVESVPALLIARLGRLGRRDYFELESSLAETPSVRKIS